MTKPVVEDKNAWELLLYYWRGRDQVTPDMRCKEIISYPDEQEPQQCVLNEAHTNLSELKVKVPHADEDGNLARLLISGETIWGETGTQWNG